MRALDEYVQGGEVELFRGVSSREYASQLRSGELYVGHGKLGGGIYAAGGTDAQSHAAEFAQDPGSVIMRLAVKHGARIADLDELVHRMHTEGHTALQIQDQDLQP